MGEGQHAAINKRTRSRSSEIRRLLISIADEHGQIWEEYKSIAQQVSPPISTGWVSHIAVELGLRAGVASDTVQNTCPSCGRVQVMGREWARYRGVPRRQSTSALPCSKTGMLCSRQFACRSCNATIVLDGAKLHSWEKNHNAGRSRASSPLCDACKDLRSRR